VFLQISILFQDDKCISVKKHLICVRPDLSEYFTVAAISGSGNGRKCLKINILDKWHGACLIIVRNVHSFYLIDRLTRRRKMKKLLVILCALALVFGLVGTAGALTINVTETFGSGSTSGITGVPTGWQLISGSNNDVGIDDTFRQGGTGDRYMWVEDDAVVGTRIDTTGFEAITLGFDWRTYSSGTSDEWRVGYAISATKPNHWGNFTELDYITRDTSWDPTSYSLSSASDTSDLWVAFFLDDDEGDYGFVDNVLVSGTPIQAPVPEPSTILLLALGILGMAGYGRKRFSKKG
jgi:hypothetical protein